MPAQKCALDYNIYKRNQTKQLYFSQKLYSEQRKPFKRPKRAAGEGALFSGKHYHFSWYFHLHLTQLDYPQRNHMFRRGARLSKAFFRHLFFSRSVVSEWGEAERDRGWGEGGLLAAEPNIASGECIGYCCLYVLSYKWMRKRTAHCSILCIFSVANV